MTLFDFIKENDVDYSYVRVSCDTIGEFESLLGVTFGEQLRKYILDYGYLAFEYCELYGINNNQKEKSDMIVVTSRLHKQFPETKGLIAFENFGDGDYFMVDSEDNVFRFICGCGEPNALNMKLFDYILRRFETVKTQI